MLTSEIGMLTILRKQTKPLALLLSFVLVLLISHQVAAFVLAVIAKDKTGVEDDVALSPVTKSAQASKKFTPVAVFGQVQKNRKVPKAKKVVPKKVAKKQVELNLKLVGVMLSTKSKMALISKSGAKSKVYLPGGKIMSGVTVKNIYDDHVMLLHDDIEKILKMEKTRYPSKAKKAKKAKRSPTPAFDPGRDSPPPTVGPVNNALHDRIDSYRQKLSENPLSLTNLFRSTPIMQDGTLKGLKIRPGTDPELFKHFGFINDDIITAVNDIPLNDTARLSELLGQVGAEPYISVVVERAGSQMDLMINLDP